MDRKRKALETRNGCERLKPTMASRGRAMLMISNLSSLKVVRKRDGLRPSRVAR